MIYLRMLVPNMMAESDVYALCRAIWPESYAIDAMQATMQDGLLNHTGQVFIIMYGGTVVGITGYFDIGSTTYLRWTGILPEFRCRGFFKQAINLLTLQLRGANPSARQLVELVPDNNYGRSIVGAFVALGFAPDSGLHVPDGEDSDWPVIPYVLTL